MIRRISIVVFLLLILTSCSKQVDLSSNEFGIVTEFGKYKSHYLGPGQIKFSGSEQVIKGNTVNQIQISNIKLIYQVQDFRLYYEDFAASNLAVQEALSRKVSNKPVSNLTTEQASHILENMSNSIKVVN